MQIRYLLITITSMSPRRGKPRLRKNRPVELEVDPVVVRCRVDLLDNTLSKKLEATLHAVVGKWGITRAFNDGVLGIPMLTTNQFGASVNSGIDMGNAQSRLHTFIAANELNDPIETEITRHIPAEFHFKTIHSLGTSLPALIQIAGIRSRLFTSLGSPKEKINSPPISVVNCPTPESVGFAFRALSSLDLIGSKIAIYPPEVDYGKINPSDAS